MLGALEPLPMGGQAIPPFLQEGGHRGGADGMARLLSRARHCHGATGVAAGHGLDPAAPVRAPPGAPAPGPESGIPLPSIFGPPADALQLSHRGGASLETCPAPSALVEIW